MFQDEKTTELNLNSEPSATPQTSVRWTEKTSSPPLQAEKSLSVASSDRSQAFLLRVAAAVSILLLSLWLL